MLLISTTGKGHTEAVQKLPTRTLYSLQPSCKQLNAPIFHPEESGGRHATDPEILVETFMQPPSPPHPNTHNPQTLPQPTHGEPAGPQAQEGAMSCFLHVAGRIEHRRGEFLDNTIPYQQTLLGEAKERGGGSGYRVVRGRGSGAHGGGGRQHTHTHTHTHEALCAILLS